MDTLYVLVYHRSTYTQFFDLLVEINATIDAFFAGSGVSELELRERLEAALRRAERAR